MKIILMLFVIPALLFGSPDLEPWQKECCTVRKGSTIGKMNKEWKPGCYIVDGIMVVIGPFDTSTDCPKKKGKKK